MVGSDAGLRTKQYGGALYFNGADNYLDLGTRYFGGPMSIMIWFRTQGGGSQKLFEAAVSGGGSGHIWGVVGGYSSQGQAEVGFCPTWTCNYAYASSSSTSYTDTWASVVFSWYADGSAKAFINGVQYASLAAQSSAIPTGIRSAVRVGNGIWTSSDNIFKGYIADFQIVTGTALGMESAIAHYSGRECVFAAPPPPPPLPTPFPQLPSPPPPARGTLPVTANLYAWFDANTLSAQYALWTDKSGNNRHATTYGTVNVTTIPAGFAATQPVRTVFGADTSSGVSFFTLPNPFTMCTVSRYGSTTSKNRIFQTPDNFLHGHYGGQAGVAHYDSWVSQYSPAETISYATNVNNWVTQCTTSTSSYCIHMVDGLESWCYKVTPQYSRLYINGGQFSNEFSANYWQVAEILLYSSQLSAAEMVSISRWLIQKYSLQAVADDGALPGGCGHSE